MEIWNRSGGWMKFFVDTADIEEVRAAKVLGLADGVTTNPTLIQKSGRNFKKTIIEIASEIDGPVNAEVTNTDTAEEIIKQGENFASWASNVTVKIPISVQGLQAVRVLELNGIRTTVTLIFSPNQALLAAKAGASYICPFVGRLDDISMYGMDLIQKIINIFSQFSNITTQVIAASLRTPNHVLESALMGAHGVTIPYKIIQQLVSHPLTDIGIERFKEDWEKVSGM
jgi:transaldolase